MSVDKSLMEKGYDDYDIVEIAKNVYKINEFNLTTMFVIVGETRALAIDCGTGIDDYKKIIEKLVAGKPYDVAITHAHVDHIGGMSQFTDFYMNERDIAIAKDVTVPARIFYTMLMKLLRFKVRPVKKLHFNKGVLPRIHNISEGFIFDLGGRKIKVFETQGHTLGSLSYLLTEERILFSGDVVNPQNLMFLKNASTIEELNSTYHRLLDMDCYDTLWASHLSKPVSREVLENGLACTEKLLHKRKTILPFIGIGNFKEYVIIHRTDRIKGLSR